ncbi:type II toxin-antitoxin system Phd/YefM family antitoxin [Kineosporia sp. NBRC 101731]|uniref:type II toxin-antitoxin system Phd/YefM family antitoxin n=1 Tax=Kineosporia sp. NBRC 101731 TaxID=3032199 RepID=UPI0025559534|nr:type II toxin-antitoxin system Phd/YefM family antitoxin [Kineosporia sp. NBRC 101731]
MIDLPRLSIRDVRERLADVVDEACHDRPTVITRRGRPVAALVPIDILRRYLELEEREINRIIDERICGHPQSEGETEDSGAPAGAVPLETVLRETASRAE